MGCPLLFRRLSSNICHINPFCRLEEPERDGRRFTRKANQMHSYINWSHATLPTIRFVSNTSSLSLLERAMPALAQIQCTKYGNLNYRNFQRLMLEITPKFRTFLQQIRECRKDGKMRDFSHDCGTVDTYGGSVWTVIVIFTDRDQPTIFCTNRCICDNCGWDVTLVTLGTAPSMNRAFWEQKRDKLTQMS